MAGADDGGGPWTTRFAVGATQAPIATRVRPQVLGTAAQLGIKYALQSGHLRANPDDEDIRLVGRYRPADDEARKNAHEWWPNTALQGVGQELPTPHHFEQAVEMITEDDVADGVVTGPEPGPYLDHIETYVDAGFDHVYLHQTGPNQEAFVDFAGEELLPAVE